ncbi:unnamed protein product [Sphagnum tenellum]
MPPEQHTCKLRGTVSYMLLFNYLPSLALTQAAVVPSSVRSMDSCIAMLNSHGVRQCRGGPCTSSIGMPFNDGANISEDGVAAGPCTHALLAPA